MNFGQTHILFISKCNQMSSKNAKSLVGEFPIDYQ